MKKYKILTVLSMLIPLTSCNLFIDDTSGGGSGNSPTSPDISSTTTTPIVTTMNLVLSKETIKVSETANLSVETTKNYNYVVEEGEDIISISGDVVTALKEGTARIYALTTDGIDRSNIVTLNVKGFVTNPYLGIDEDAFYSNYYPATSFEDATLRTEANIMSGSIEDQDQRPTIDSSRPKDGSKFVRNSSVNYNKEKNSWSILDSKGNVVNTIYKGGAYVSLEEVAAYVLAFGDIPANYTESKRERPSSSPWGKWLRLNHSFFNGDTSRYPYEPALPDISGVNSGGTKYYELDIGTTGTDCDPNYSVVPYNTGVTITRGAARIVYGRTDLSGNQITDLNNRHVFYTYNHYNDFQEYLNYENGWGEIFGNITGGGQLSSKDDYNPTPYVEVSFRSLLK